MAFEFQDNQLVWTDGHKQVSIQELCANREEPVYIYDLHALRARFEEFCKAFAPSVKLAVHYAVKANAHPKVLKTLAELGAGADVVSGGEVEAAVNAGIPADRVVFSGVGKTVAEIRRALELGIKQLNVESPQELSRIGVIARDMKVVARVAFRMNPDVDPETHPYIKTGFRDNKFGMDESFLPELEETLAEYKDSLSLQGLTIHIGSQLRELTATLDAIRKTKVIYQTLLSKGYPLSTFDVGGGLGINYHDNPGAEEAELIQTYGREVSELVKDLDCELLTEPGRILVARTGVLCGEVQYVKKSPYKSFAILNTGMHHLMRPSLYQAFHRIVKVSCLGNEAQRLYDVVGPICESSDVLGFDRALPELEAGDWLAVMDAGAYGASMASTYNAHALPDELVIDDGRLV